MYSKHTCALKNTSKPKSLIQVEVSQFLPQKPNILVAQQAVGGQLLCELTWTGISSLFPAPLLFTLQLWERKESLPALFSSHLLCLSDIIIFLAETVLDYWGTSKPPRQAYKHGMICSPVFDLCHSLYWEMSLQESSIEVYYLWAKPAFLSNPHMRYVPSHNALTALWCLPSKEQPLLLPSISWAQSLWDKIHRHKRSSGLQLGWIQSSDMGRMQEAELFTCADTSLVSLCSWKGTAPKEMASPSAYPFKSSAWKATITQIQTFSVRWITKAIISLGFFQLSLALKRWQSKKARVSCQKMRVQSCIKFIATYCAGLAESVCYSGC